MSRFFIKSIHQTTKPGKGKVATSIALFLCADIQKNTKFASMLCRDWSDVQFFSNNSFATPYSRYKKH